MSDCGNCGNSFKYLSAVLLSVEEHKEGPDLVTDNIPRNEKITDNRPDVHSRVCPIWFDKYQLNFIFLGFSLRQA